MSILKSSRILCSTVLLCCMAAATAVQASPFIFAEGGRTEAFSEFSSDDNANSWKLGGGWRFNEYFELSLGYTDFGKFSDSFTIDPGSSDIPGSGEVEGEAYDLTAHGLIPMGDGFGFSGKLGVEFWEFDGTRGFVGPTATIESGSASGENAYVGIGAFLDVSSHFRLHLNFDLHKWKDRDEHYDQRVFSLGLSYHFGDLKASDAADEEDDY